MQCNLTLQDLCEQAGFKPQFAQPEFLISQGFTKTLPWRLFKKIHKTESCWLFSSSINDDGYGQIRAGSGKTIKAHQAMWILCNGPIQLTMNILHTCDNPPCVKPDHLYQGTRSQNMQDMWDRNRHSSATGEQNPKAVLTAENALYILESTKPRRELADQFGVCIGTIDAIKTGRNWKHLSGTNQVDL